MPSHPGTTLFIGAQDLWNHLGSAGHALVWAVPGAAVEQAKSRRIETCVIDNSGFDSGAWLGADSGTRRSVANEVFETGRSLRARGGNVLYIAKDNRPLGVDEPYIRSTSTVLINEIPQEDLEENAPQSKLWSDLAAFVESRR